MSKQNKFLKKLIRVPPEIETYMRIYNISDEELKYEYINMSELELIVKIKKKKSCNY